MENALSNCTMKYVIIQFVGKKRENPVAIILINDIHNSQYFQSNPNNNKNLYKNGWQKWSFSFFFVVVKFQFVFIVGVASR